MKTITIFERPPMENPIYGVIIHRTIRFIQLLELRYHRHDGGMTSSDEWHEVEKLHNHWVPIGGFENAIPIGFTKNEAIQNLKEKYSHLKTNIMKTNVKNEKAAVKTAKTTKSTKSVKESKSAKENGKEVDEIQEYHLMIAKAENPVKKILPQNSKKAEKLIKKSEVVEEIEGLVGAGNLSNHGPKGTKEEKVIKQQAKKEAKPVKPTKEEKKEKEVEQKPTFTRTIAMATILKDHPEYDDEKAMKLADSLYVKESGKSSNLKEQAFCCRYVRQMMTIFFPKS